jgi:hypothetical protein
MYIAAIIQLSNGEQKTIEAESWGALTILKFVAKIRKYAKKENKIVKILSDDWNVLSYFSRQLPDVKAEFEVNPKEVK